MTMLLLRTETNPSGVSYVNVYHPSSDLEILESFHDSFILEPNLQYHDIHQELKTQK